MTERAPQCDPESVFSVKRACAELGVTRKTLRKLRDIGVLTPVNPDNKYRLKYSGRSLIDCWYKAIRL
jgi:hypothetical protein